MAYSASSPALGVCGDGGNNYAPIHLLTNTIAYLLRLKKEPW
jgi:hypothetical protein